MKNARRDNVLAYYTSAHGFGHAVRTCDILNAFCQQFPDVQVHLTTGVSLDFLHSRINSKEITGRQGSFDVGMIQRDSVQVDIPATFDAVHQLCENVPALIEQEIDFLKQISAGLVVVDILPFLWKRHPLSGFLPWPSVILPGTGSILPLLSTMHDGASLLMYLSADIKKRIDCCGYLSPKTCTYFRTKRISRYLPKPENLAARNYHV